MILLYMEYKKKTQNKKTELIKTEWIDGCKVNWVKLVKGKNFKLQDERVLEI